METWDVALLAPFGIVAGLLTTLAGMGGGLFLVAALGAWMGPRDALAVSTPALFVSNVHRAHALRAHLSRPTFALFALGAVPGAALGALTAAAVPESVLSALLVAVTAIAFARFAGWLRVQARPGAVVPAAFGIGAFAGTSGGAGALVAPLYLALGMTGSAYVATTSASAVVVHAARIVGYGATGMFSAALLPGVASLLVGLVVGNLVGLRIRPRLGEKATRRVEAGALATATVLAVAKIFV